ncbi:hypothetical protein RJ641_010113 [Dillenia turbinata]|uniref:Uncharacterized protein n=1 Tax=Dillenia turbinata TaxID=194707 RepID=A0AAN8Z805_9MAGN
MQLSWKIVVAICLLNAQWKGDFQKNMMSLVLGFLLEILKVLRCIHVGLLCVQEFAKDRPTVYALLSMLTSEVTCLPAHKQPGFVERQIRVDTESSKGSHTRGPKNNLTITISGGVGLVAVIAFEWFISS